MIEKDESKDFIKKLQRERTDYKYASQVRTIAKSLIQLSVGIYTEPERFVYELLQNAVDAFSDTGSDTLEVLIKADQDKFVFMHNGKAFDEKDVEGICDVGNGTKSNDSKKIGYKGIGFKSVFMPSVNRVSVISGQFCFEFDKQKACSLMPSFPSEDGVLGLDDIPWQVIPIEASHLRELSEPGFNVITVVYTQEANKIGSRVEQLFSDLQFLLFLRCNNVNIRFERDGRYIFSVEKKQNNVMSDYTQNVTLYKNGQAQSNWMLFTKDVEVPSEVKIALEHDFNTPDKLKGAEKVEISFAVQINDNEVVPLKNTTVFTFLPTSYRGLRQPFLINSNFITDAGRQQLHQESEWNKLIFKKVPELYLSFVSQFSKKYVNYTEVLPTIYPDNDTLVGVYRSQLNDAFDNIAFVPNRIGERLLKLGEVLVDKTGVSKGIIPIEKILKHLNSKRNKHFTEDSFVDNDEIVEYAHNLIYLFGNDDLINLLTDRSTTTGISIEDDITLIRFLYEHFQQPQNNDDSYINSLADTSILYDENGELRRFNELFFPSNIKNLYEEATNVSILNVEIFDAIKDNSSMVSWLKSLGIRELSNMSFVEYLYDHPEYITTANALSIGRFLFSVWKKENFLDEESNAEKTKNLCFLSKGGQLQPICNLYLGSIYRPEDDMEIIKPQTDLFISEDYSEGSDIDDWAFFLKKCGAIYKIGISEKDYSVNDLGFNFIQETADSFRDCPKPINPYKDYYGFKNPIINIHFRVSYFTFVDFNNPNYEVDKFVFSKILSMNRGDWKTIDKIYGIISYWGKRVEQRLSEFAPYEYKSRYKSFLEYVIANEQKFPTTKGVSVAPSEVFINNPTTVELAGNYLPILAIDTKVHESWLTILPFKMNLTIDDILNVLEGVSMNDDEEKDAKKERISKLYREIIDRGEQCSPNIREWAKTHRILSHSGNFLPASELTYITVDGFKNGENRVYCEKIGKDNREKLLQLLRTFGVQVITQKDITTEFTNSAENEELKIQLLKKSQYLAVLRDNAKLDFEEKKAELDSKIQKTHFFKCDSISLTYGVDKDIISKSTFSKGDCFYYTGRITPALMEPLLSPLCSHLNLGSSNESKLMVILITNDHQSLVDYLKDSGYDVSKLESPEKHHSIESPVAEDIEKKKYDDDLPSFLGANSGERIVEAGALGGVQQEFINKELRIRVKNFLEEHYYDVSAWNIEDEGPDVKDCIKDPEGNIITVVIRSAKGQKIHLSTSSFGALMSRPTNLLVVLGVDNKLHTIDFKELFGNNSKVNLIFDAKYTPIEYFQALSVIFKYVKNTSFVVENPRYSTHNELKGFGLNIKNEGDVLLGDTSDI